jgi:hypothetical protein
MFFDDVVFELTPWITVLIGKLIVAQLVKKFPALYGTRVVKTMFGKSPPLVCVLSQMTPHLHILPFKIRVNIVIPSTPVSSIYSLPFRFPTKILCPFVIFHACYIRRPYHLLDLITVIMFGAAYSCRMVWGVGLDRSDTEVVGSNLVQGKDVCSLLSVLCCPVQVEALRRADH